MFGPAAIGLLDLSLLILLFCAAAFAVKPAAQEHYDRGLALERQGRFPDAIDAYQKAAWADWNFAEPYNRMALLYIDLDDPTTNIKAEEAIGKALKIDPDNPEYHLTYGKLLKNLDRTLDARDEFSIAAKLDSTNTEALSLLGLNNEESWVRYRDAISLSEDVIYDLGSQTTADRENAAESYRKVLKLEPDNLDTFLRLFLIHYETKNQEKIEELYQSNQQVWDRDPDDWHTWLYKGLVLQSLYRFEEADSIYRIALKTMPAEDEVLFESMEMIITPDQEKEIRKRMQQASPDSAGQTDYERKLWLEKDPLYLTDVNERELEHFRRIAYADIRYRDPVSGRRGYETDQGKLFIRYGEPREKATILPDLNLDMSWSGSAEELDFGPSMFAGDSAGIAKLSGRLKEEIYRAYAPRTGPGSHPLGYMEEMAGSGGRSIGRDIWNYGDFVLTFRDWGGHRHYNLLPDRENDVPTIIKETPDIFIPDYGGENFDLYGYYATFRGENDRTLLDLSYSIPTRWLEHEAVTADWQRADFDHGVFIFDSDYDEVYRDVSREPLVIKAEGGRLPGELIVDEQYLELAPGSYHLSVEVQDKKTKNTGVSRQELELPAYGRDRLEMSDLVVAYKVEPRNKIYFSRNEVIIRSNPSRIFKREQTLHVYYEIYNLRQDPSGRSIYQVETTVAQPNWKRREGVSRFFFDLGKVFGLGREGVYIGIASKYTSPYESHPRVETVDIKSLEPRQYLFNVRVTDLLSNDSVDKDFLFAVAADSTATTN